jgi:hypothetical protein
MERLRAAVRGHCGDGMRLAPEVRSVVYDTGEQLHGGGYNPTVRRDGGQRFRLTGPRTRQHHKGTPVKTALLEGKKPAHFDKHIIGNLLLDVASPDEVRAEDMLIGVRNEAGEIYRLIGATKLNSFMNAVEELFDLGLVDELQDTEEPKDGCDAIFSEP